MLKSFLRLISTAEIMQHDDWRERLKARSKANAKIALVLFAVVIVLLILIRIIT